MCDHKDFETLVLYWCAFPKISKILPRILRLFRGVSIAWVQRFWFGVLRRCCASGIQPRAGVAWFAASSLNPCMELQIVVEFQIQCFYAFSVWGSGARLEGLDSNLMLYGHLRWRRHKIRSQFHIEFCPSMERDWV